MLYALLLLAIGLALVIKSADWLVDGASSLARRLHISELAIGLTIVSFGTSLPELTVNIFSSFSGANDIAVGNIVGSNIANILLILGVSAVISRIRVQPSTAWREIPFSLLAAVLLIIFANDVIIDKLPASVISLSDGLTLIAVFFVFLWYIVSIMKAEGPPPDNHAGEKSVPVAMGLVLIGIIGLILGGKLAVDGAVTMATLMGVSQALIGLTVVAIGTSLPELATSAVAARKGKADIAIGNIVGSNIFNILWILGISATIKPLPFNPAMNTDLLIMLGATLLLFYAIHTGHVHQRFLFWRQREGHVLERSDGIFMLVCFAAYLAFVVWRG